MSKAGPSLLQAGHPQEVTKDNPAESRTLPDATPTKAGLPKNTISAQQEHNISITGKDLPKDLTLVVESWPHLPDPIKAAIKALIDSSPKKAGK